MPYFMMHCTALRWIIGCLIVMSGLMPATGRAQALSPPGLLGGGSAAARWHVEPLPTPARPGEHLTVRFAASIEAGWSLYAPGSPVGQPLRIRFEALPDGAHDTLRLYQAAPVAKYDPHFEAEALLYRQAADVRAVVPLPEGLTAGTHEVRGTIRYMLCSDQMCLPPRSAPFAISVEVVPGRPRPAYATGIVDGLMPLGPAAPPAAPAHEK